MSFGPTVFSDQMYNFLKNNGIGLNNKTIQIDFGELVFDEDTVRKHVADKRWLEMDTFQNFPDSPIKKCCQEILDQNLTIANFEKLWKTNKLKLRH